MADDDSPHPHSILPDVSRRDFLKISGITAAAPLVLGPVVVQAAGQPVEVYGPEKVAVTLTINGKRQTLQLEPRVTLLDALRDHLELTGAKRVCDHGSCGACTVLLDGRAVYACSVLAIDAQGRAITTIESLSQGERLHPIQQAFVEHDALQCGFCTPGFVMASKALLDKNPHPTPEQVRLGLSGNFCRCGAYQGLREALAQAAGEKGSERNG
jgi:xanthine dehydrogenase YagT iron-sulfur-binding subunit